MLCKLSGDIKSPLQSISGFSQALLDGLGGELNEKQDKYIKIINKNSGELSYFLDKLLEFSWAQSTLLNVDCKNFDVVNSLQNILKPAGIVLDYEELNKKNIYSDENLIKIIVQNLIDCSAKIADTGAITVKIMELKDESESDTVKITVTNKGIGLSDAEKADLFDPYSQLEKPGRKGVLRSLSLASIEILVKKLGGDVWIESGIMQGTAFNVILPGNVGSEQLAVSS
jgi:signal transduction histidine kinase